MRSPPRHEYSPLVPRASRSNSVKSLGTEAPSQTCQTALFPCPSSCRNPVAFWKASGSKSRVTSQTRPCRLLVPGDPPVRSASSRPRVPTSARRSAGSSPPCGRPGVAEAILVPARGREFLSAAVVAVSPDASGSPGLHGDLTDPSLGDRQGRPARTSATAAFSGSSRAGALARRRKRGGTLLLRRHPVLLAAVGRRIPGAVEDPVEGIIIGRCADRVVDLWSWQRKPQATVRPRTLLPNVVDHRVVVDQS